MSAFDTRSDDTIGSLAAGVIKVAEPGEPKMTFFVVPRGTSENDLEVVSYVSMKALKEALSPELYAQVMAALGLSK